MFTLLATHGTQKKETEQEKRKGYREKENA
jgi:hypothetical protein